MSEKTTGIYRILNAPFLYELTQNLFWRKGKRLEFIKNEISLLPGSKILDIGCGTGLLYKTINKHNIDIDYVGLDLNPSYIEFATNQYPKAKFFCSDVANLSQIINEKFDVIIILNVLHHLDDVLADNLLCECKQYLRENGRLLTLDPVRTQRASLIERLMIESDRGQHIRNAEEYYALAKKSFKRVKQKLKTRFLKLPMTVNILECFINE